MPITASYSRRVSWVGVASICFGLSCAPSPEPTADLLFVTIDTLRADRWGCLGDPRSRSPFADRIARGGLLAFEGRAPAPLTLPSHVSMMTGLAPNQHGVRDNGIFALAPDRGVTVAQALQAENWTTAAFVSAFPLARRFGVDRGFEVYDEFLGGGEDEGSAGFRQRTANETVARVERWFSRRPPDAARRLFAWVHFFDPHADYAAPAPWPAAFPGRAYDAEVAFVDREFGRLTRRLIDLRGDRPLRIVIASDHGESLGEHGEDTHGVLLHAATIRVPIVVRGDAYIPRLRAEPVPLESIARSLLDLAGSSAALDPGAADGVVSFHGPTHAETLYPAFNFGWRGLRAREAEGWKLIIGANAQLFDIASDPAETSDRAAADPDRVASLGDALRAAFSHAVASTPLEASAEETEMLRSLGYLSAGGAETGSLEQKFEEGPDPSTRIHLLDPIQRGTALLDGGHPEEAERLLAHVVAADPANRLALEFLGRAQFRLGKAAAARATLQRALALGPNPTPVYLDLARAARALGDRKGERAVLEQAVAKDPRSPAIRLALARCLIEDGDVVAAGTMLEEATQRHPKFVELRVVLARVYETQGRTKEAEEQWRRVIEIDPDGPAAKIARHALGPESKGAKESEGTS